MKLVDLNDKNVITITVLEEDTPTIIKWNPKRDSVAAVGYKSGKITFLDVHTLQTLTLTIDQESVLGGDPSSGVTDMSWD